MYLERFNAGCQIEEITYQAVLIRVKKYLVVQFHNLNSYDLLWTAYTNCNRPPNGPQFATAAKCKEFCGVVSETILRKEKNGDADDTWEMCTAQKDVGPCRAAIPKYFYNAATGVCEAFVYGGCDGNANNFESAEDCDAKCRRVGIVEL